MVGIKLYVKNIIKKKIMLIYKIHTERNLADTTRDPDNIVLKEI
jgi:hypothetical protein